MQEVFLGVDVAKNWLDVHHPGRSMCRIENTPAAVRVFAVTSARVGVWVVFEASGGYDRLLREALEAAGVRFSRVNPRQARDFAKAMDVIGKTDRVDARMLAELGVRLRPPATEPLDAARRALQAQATRRRQRMAYRKQEATRLQQTADGESRDDIRSLIALLDRRMAKVEARMADLVKADPELAEIDRRLQTVPGVGPIVAATPIACRSWKPSGALAMPSGCACRRLNRSGPRRGIAAKSGDKARTRSRQSGWRGRCQARGAPAGVQGLRPAKVV